MSHEIEKNNAEANEGKVFDSFSHENIPKNTESVRGIGNLEKSEEAVVASHRNHARLLDQDFVRAWTLDKSPHTARAYKRVISEFLDFLQPRTLKDASLGDVQNFVSLKASWKKTTIAVRGAILKSLFSYGVKSGYLTANLGVFIKGYRADYKIRERYLTEEEVMGMVAVASKQSTRDEALLRLLYSSGARNSEIAQLNFEHLLSRENGEGQITFFGKGQKKREVVVSSATWNALMKLKSENSKPTHPVFRSDYGMSTRITDRTIRNIVSRVAINAGVSKKVSPHWLRHAHASHALDRGAPLHLLQQTLGHASIATTGVYAHARPKESSGKFLGI